MENLSSHTTGISLRYIDNTMEKIFCTAIFKPMLTQFTFVLSFIAYSNLSHLVRVHLIINYRVGPSVVLILVKT
jgi:hypothetical protein